MVDPFHITNFNRTQDELEEFAIFAVLVAGKTATTIAPRLDNFLSQKNRYITPFKYIDKLSQHPEFFSSFLKSFGFGCYNQKAETLTQLCEASLDLRTCTAEDLERIKGVGLKTSRFFLLHSRPNLRYAVLDTHILKGLRDYGLENVPLVTPKSPKIYARLEHEFLKICDSLEKRPEALDLEWWTKYNALRAANGKDKTMKGVV
jgi:thermostable 8-oxoguanine DNA glycosylase